MKGHFYPLLIIIVISAAFIGCKTAGKLYEKGNYDEAVELAVKKIQKKPDDGELRYVLQNAYRYAVDDHERRIRNLSGNNNELKWEWIYNEYSSLQRLYDAIHRSPEAMSIVRATDYSSYLDTYSEKAAGVRFERGLRWMDKNDKQSYRNAYHEFQAALRFQPGDFTIKSKLDEAYAYALVNVVVMPMDNFDYRFSSYNHQELKNLENDLLRNLQYHTGNPFVKFYSEWDARSRNIHPDQFIYFRFGTMNIGRVKDEPRTRELSKEVVIKETVYRPDSIVKEYKKVFARLTTTKRTMLSEGSLKVNIRDNNGRWLWSDIFTGNHTWSTEFSTFTGDERALSETDKQLVNQKRENPPYEEAITRHILQEINNGLLNRIRNYYNQY